MGAPAGFESGLGALPNGASFVRGRADVAVLFSARRANLERRLPAALASVDAGAAGVRGKLWIAWPKKTSPLAGKVSQDDVRRAALAAGWVDVKVCALDADWSGLCFVPRAL